MPVNYLAIFILEHYLLAIKYKILKLNKYQPVSSKKKTKAHANANKK
jgi:hypothetical protein